MSGDAMKCVARRDARGALVALEGGRDVPFAVARVYYVYDTPAGVARGFHAHRELEQFAIAVAGSVTMRMDDGRRNWEVRLDSPERGVHIPAMVWHEMHDFSSDCVLLVLASAPYDERDYIRDLGEFKALCG